MRVLRELDRARRCLPSLYEPTPTVALQSCVACSPIRVKPRLAHDATMADSPQLCATGLRAIRRAVLDACGFARRSGPGGKCGRVQRFEFTHYESRQLTCLSRRLAAPGIERLMLGTYGLPPRVRSPEEPPHGASRLRRIAWELRAANRDGGTLVGKAVRERDRDAVGIRAT